MSRELWDAQLSAAKSEMMALPDSEQAEYARRFRVAMGFESRFRSYRRGPFARFWNWLINADRTR